MSSISLFLASQSLRIWWRRKVSLHPAWAAEEATCSISLDTLEHLTLSLIIHLVIFLLCEIKSGQELESIIVTDDNWRFTQIRYCISSIVWRLSERSPFRNVMSYMFRHCKEQEQESPPAWQEVCLLRHSLSWGRGEEPPVLSGGGVPSGKTRDRTRGNLPPVGGQTWQDTVLLWHVLYSIHYMHVRSGRELTNYWVMARPVVCPLYWGMTKFKVTVRHHPRQDQRQD